jgi:type IV pilus assembly protein PilW
MHTLKNTDRVTRVRPRNTQGGFTLIELLIASLLGIFVIGGVLKVLSNTTTMKALGNGLTEVQDNGRYALEAVVDAVRYRGFQGCILPAVLDQTRVENVDWGTTSQTRSISRDFPLTNLSVSSLRGYEVSDDGVWAPDPASQGFSADIVALRNATNTPAPIKGSDVISVQYASPVGVNLSSTMLSPADPVEIGDNPGAINTNSIVFIGNCELGELFQVSADPGNAAPFSLQHALSHNTSTSLSRPYSTGAEVRPFHVDTFFIGDTGRQDVSGNMIPALYRRDINGNVTELVEGVERLEVRYGEVLSTGNVKYLGASAMSADDWPKVVSVEIGVLVRTTREVLLSHDTQSYSLPGVRVTPNTQQGYTPGRYFRKVFTTLVQLRNRA